MSYVLLGRTIKNEYLSLAVLGTAFGGAFLATRGGPRRRPSRRRCSRRGRAEEEQFILNFIAEAEKESAVAAPAH
ncbi:hypothetical protein B0H34DRAFT_711176 [Crassisporium funariophilum]|nr:hypothetical protein B0H34DRAFT_711176 [Crassisporium funariophilum]